MATQIYDWNRIEQAAPFNAKNTRGYTIAELQLMNSEYRKLVKQALDELDEGDIDEPTIEHAEKHAAVAVSQKWRIGQAQIS